MLFALAALLGVGAAVLPAVAVSESSTTVEALAPYSWSPSRAAVKPGAVVTFQNNSGILHGIIWKSATEPECSAEVPVGVGHFSSSWKGTCTFAQEGVYAYECSYHMALMRGTVYVNAAGAVPGEGTPPTPTPTTPTSTLPVTSTTPATSTAGTSLASGGEPTEPAAGSPLAGSAAAAIKLASSQRGQTVRGSVAISESGAGGKLTVELFARHGALAHSAQAASVAVGRAQRASLHAGRVPFAVALDARAKRALRRAHRLALSVRIVLTPLEGSAVSVTRSVVLRT